MGFLRRPFLVVHNLTEFAILCALIHGDKLPEDRLREILKKLHHATEELKKAEQHADHRSPTDSIGE
jgi:hypothetical protein